MNIEKLEQEINNAQSVINEKKVFIQKTRQDIAEHLCPFSVGDKVLNQDGKMEFIASVYSKPFQRGYGFTVYKIKVSGQPYINSCEAWYKEKYTKFIN